MKKSKDKKGQQTAKIPPVRVTTDGFILFIETDPSYIREIEPIAKADPGNAPLLPYEVGSRKKIGNIVTNPEIIGFSKEAIAVIKEEGETIGSDVAMISAWDSIAGPTFNWMGYPCMMITPPMLTLTKGTKEFDFSKFQSIPNYTPIFAEYIYLR